MGPFTLFTCAYSRFDPSMGLPVQISNGRPRWKLKYELRNKLPDLYPEWRLVKDRNLPVAEFRRQYWEGLDRYGVKKLGTEFSALAAETGEQRLVLMCFEKSIADCHRGDFAMWWLKNTGEIIEELPASQPVPEEPGALSDLPPALF